MPADRSGDTDADLGNDRRVLLVTTGIVLAMFSVGAATQAVYVYASGAPLQPGDAASGLPSLLLRVSVNLCAVLTVLVGAALAGLHRRSASAFLLIGTALAVGVAIERFALQNAVGIYSSPPLGTGIVELTASTAVTTLALLGGIAQVRSRRMLRAQVRAYANQQVVASNALAALSAEELRVHRSVAEALHGGLQARLVMIRVQLDGLAQRWAADQPCDHLGVLNRVRDEVDALREEDVRQLSHLLYPTGVEIGVGHALRQLVKHVPPEIAIDAHIEEPPDWHDDSDEPDRQLAWRVALVRTAEEGITNALRHGGAKRIGIRLTTSRPAGQHHARLVVEDDGSGIDLQAPWNGLSLATERLRRFGGRLRLEAAQSGGTRLVAELPLLSGRPAASGLARAHALSAPSEPRTDQ